MKKRKNFILTLCVCFMAVFFFTLAQAADAPKKITFVAGTVGGAWYNSAAVLAQVMIA